LSSNRRELITSYRLATWSKYRNAVLLDVN